MMENAILHWLYGNAVGRWILCILLKLGLPKLISRYLRSRLSRKRIPKYIKKHGISMQEYPRREYGSFAEFFSRRKRCHRIDPDSAHFISPCDGYLTVCPIRRDSSFQIKGSHYRIRDLISDPAVADAFLGGLCLIFRMTASDYHRYIFPDDGFVSKHHDIEGALHSVQPIACEAFPVYRLNRRCWTILDTYHFGRLLQVEIGALAVGGIVNEKENEPFRKGDEMGYFTLCGSTIVLFMQQARLRLLPEIQAAAAEGNEYRVAQGDWIGTQENVYLLEGHRKNLLRYCYFLTQDDQV